MNSAVKRYTFLIKENTLSFKEEQLVECLGDILGSKRVAKVIFNHVRGDLHSLFRIGDQELLSLPHIREKHVRLVNRLKTVIKNIIKPDIPLHNYQLNCPEAVYGFILPYIIDEDREIFIGIPLNSSLVPVTSPVVISIGTHIESIVQPGYYYKVMVELGAVCSIAVHNHPSSGDPSPSPEDIKTTRVLVRAGKILGIPLKDHVIIGNGKFYSFAASGRLRKM